MAAEPGSSSAEQVLSWRRLPRRAELPQRLFSLVAGFVLVFGLTAWARGISPDEPSQIPLSGQRTVARTVAAVGPFDAEATAAAQVSGGPAATDEAQPSQAGFSSHGPTNRRAVQAAEDAPLQPTASAAPNVEIRVGEHGEFERVVFEWPEAIDYDVVHQGEQVIVTFARLGRIDFSGVRDRFGHRVVEARAEGGEETKRVVLRVLPDARVHSFSLENDRIVAVDVFGRSAPRQLAQPALQPEPARAQGASQQHTVAPELAAIGHQASSHEVEDSQVRPTGGAVPDVAVRVGDHGNFERVVFEWPEAIRHKVASRGDQVVVAFGRPGRIDLSPVRGFGRRVIDAQAEGGEVTRRVVLRVLPNASIRSLSLEGDRIVVIDVFDGTAPESLAQSAPDSERGSIRELRQAIEHRDAVIDNLLARVEQLEREMVLSSGDLDRVAAGGVGATPPIGDAPLPRPVVQGTTVAQVASGETASEPSAPPGPERQPAPPSQDQGGAGTNAAAKPGQFEVVEEEIDRALERTLVQTGVLLLPMGQAEVEPYFGYTRRETDANMVAFIDGGLPVGAETDVRRDEFVTGLNLRFGLPFDSQVEFDLPYRFVDQSTVTRIGFGERAETDHSGHGIGDLSIGVAKTLVREDGHWWPDLIGRFTWDTDTGKTTSNDVALGGGFNELRGSLSAVKRQDPLAFIGGVSYQTTFENDNVKPGDELGFTIGTVLAASPATSLRLVLDQSFIDNTRVDGEGINGSNSVIGMASLGASVVLGRGVLLDVAADIGLTDDAPDYAVRTSLPIRFNLPAF